MGTQVVAPVPAPFNAYYTDSLIDHDRNVVALNYGGAYSTYSHFMEIGRYQRSIYVGRMLTLAEYDTWLADSNEKKLGV